MSTKTYTFFGELVHNLDQPLSSEAKHAFASMPVTKPSEKKTAPKSKKRKLTPKAKHLRGWAKVERAAVTCYYFRVHIRGYKFQSKRVSEKTIRRFFATAKADNMKLRARVKDAADPYSIVDFQEDMNALIANINKFAYTM